MAPSEAVLAPIEPDAEVTGRDTQRAARPSNTHRSLPPRQTANLLLATLWFALITGAAESVYWGIHKYVLGELIFLNDGVLWMAPVTYLGIFAVLGAPLLALSRVTCHPALLNFSVTLLAVLSSLSILLFVPQLHTLAQVALAGGIATGVGLLFERRPDFCLRLMKRSLGVIVIGLAMMAIAGAVNSNRQRNPQIVVQQAPQGAPNVLFLMLDTVRADALGTYGAAGTATPNLDRLAKQGVLFEQATSAAAWTLPSTAAMMTGRLPHEVAPDWSSRLDPTYPTIADYLHRHGYATAGFAANTRYCTAEVGLDRGFEHFEDHRLSFAEFRECTTLGRWLAMSTFPAQFGCCDTPGRKSAADINASALDWLSKPKDGRPYFAFLNYLDAHDPYVAAAPFDAHLPKTTEERLKTQHFWWLNKEQLTPAERQFAADAYADCIRSLDHQIGQLLDELERRGYLDNTLIVVTADHGEHFGEHGLLLHGNSLYQALIHVPLFVILPGSGPSGKRVAEPVSLTSLPATIAELTGLGERQPFPGRSLSGWWDDSLAPTRDAEIIISEITPPPIALPCQGRSPVARGSMQSIRMGAYKFILNGDGVEELYDLSQDPAEVKDLSHNETHAALLEKLRRELIAHTGHHPATAAPAGF